MLQEVKVECRNVFFLDTAHSSGHPSIFYHCLTSTQGGGRVLELIPATVGKEGYILNESPVYRTADIGRRSTLVSTPTDKLESPIVSPSSSLVFWGFFF